MAAYGALVSLMHIIDRIQNHPSPPISIDKQQLESLTENIILLQDFLDGYISPVADGHEADPLESRIADAAYAAEDVIETQIVVQIDNRSTIDGKILRFTNMFRGLCKCVTIEDDFYQDLQQVIGEMKLIKQEVMKTSVEVEAQLQRKVSSTHAAGSSSTVKESIMVGFDDELLEVLEKLTGGQRNHQIITIMGMGGIGKTTLARNIFENALIKEYFDICAWTTISQTYNVRETLREVLFQASGDSSDLSENQLGEKLYKYLSGRRYLIIMDDMWSIEVWDKMRSFFPDYNNGSRLIVTTRLSKLGSQLSESSNSVGMKFLDESSSWDLFCKTVFGEESFPDDLWNIGKNIVANCKGLPLSIATIGGLLAKSERTRGYWERIEQNLNSIVMTNNDEFCLKVLKMSYIYLPNYLKPCFLYMGVFEEDRRICVSTLKKLWVSEGFLKPMSGKCLETIAKEYLKDLVDRNLILVDKLGATGNVKYCKIHDLLRDLCLKEVEKDQRFYRVIKDINYAPPAINRERRVVFPNDTKLLFSSEVLGSFSHARSITCDDYEEIVRMPHNVRLLRTLKTYDRDTHNSEYYTLPGVCFLDNVFELVNSRHLAVRVHWNSKFPSSIDLLWNLHTLIIHNSLMYVDKCIIGRRYLHLSAPIEIWKLHQLRHLEFVDDGVYLPDPPSGDEDIVIMENLQTLKGARNLYLNQEVVKRIPNVKKLYLMHGVTSKNNLCYDLYCLSKLKEMEMENSLSYLECLSKLENFHCSAYDEHGEYLRWIRFPHSLKKLSLNLYYRQELEDVLQKIGSLPLLQKLVLRYGSFKTRKWETSEGQFQSLKFLSMEECKGLEDWTISENSHFPLLQKLRLHSVRDLQEIPSELGEIATLKSISLKFCSESVVLSAKKIVEEQEELNLRVRVVVRKEAEALKSLASANFEVEVKPY